MSIHIDKNDSDVHEEIRKLKRDVTHLFDALSDDARHRVRDLSKLAKAKTLTAQTAVEGALNERPFAALGIAAGFGVLLGIYLSGRR